MNTYYTPSLLSIQTGLEQLWPLIDFYSSHPGLSNYSAPVLEAAKTVEQMITLLAYEHGFSINERNVVRTNTGEVVADMFTSPFAFVMKGFIVNHGSTSYVVTLHFLGRGKETIEDKIRRLIFKDIKKGDF